jgi:pyridoxamine 5'-phosphate oxidase
MSDTQTNEHGLAIADLRREYSLEGLDEGDLDPSPFRQFERWFRQAMDAQVLETNAMTLATATRDGVPSARIVLLKGMDDDGFVFASRSELSRLGAWASRQSTTIPDRSYLDNRLAELIDQYRDGEIPLPPYWGGYRLVPRSFEFWHGRPNRLHDRLCYTREPDGSWSIKRLSP